MKITLDNGKTVNIPDTEIQQSKTALRISTTEAVEMWLDDHDYTQNAEQIALDEKAKEVKANFVDARTVTLAKEKKERKPVTKKISEEKKQLFNDIFANLTEIYGENAQIINENKLIQVKIGNKSFKIDVVEHRPPKNK